MQNRGIKSPPKENRGSPGSVKGRFGPGGHYRYQNSGHDETRTYAREHSYARAHSYMHARLKDTARVRTLVNSTQMRLYRTPRRSLNTLLVFWYITISAACGNRGACLRASHVCDVNVLNASTFTSIGVIFRCIYAMTSLRKIYGASLEHHVCTLVTLVHL